MRKVKEIMTQPVKSVQGSMSGGDVISFFKVNKISGAPVVNDKGFAIGLISRSDLISEEGLEGKKVRDLMTPFLFEICPDEDLVKVAESMVEAKIRRVVVTEEQKPVGIVTAFDLISDYAKCLRKHES